MGLADRNHLHIPFPGWARDGELRDGRDFENWKELQRWADRITLPEPKVIPFHWPGSVADHINVRNGAGKFFYPGKAWRIEYVFDTAPASGVTVSWYFDGSGTATWTHSLDTSDEQSETEYTPYSDEHIVGIVTAADSTAAGLTAFVHLD